MNENKKNYLRAISVIELAAWTQHHLLKPVTPENDGLLPCMPWREDVEKFDDSTKGVFLDEPDDFNLINQSEEAVNFLSEVPLITECYNKMERNSLKHAARYHFFELTTNPRNTHTQKLLKEIAKQTSSDRMLLPASEVVVRGAFTIGPLGIIERLYDHTWFDEAPEIRGNLQQYTQLVLNFEHTGCSITKNHLFDFECIGWPSTRFKWLQDSMIIEKYSEVHLHHHGMLLFRDPQWTESKTNVSDIAESVRNAIETKSTSELIDDLKSCFTKHPGLCFEGQINWELAPLGEQIVKQKNWTNLSRGEAQQLLLSMNPSVTGLAQKVSF